MRDLAFRLSGSSDLYDHNLRRPWQSINFVTAHDGFTLRDLVSYEHKHNEANGEENRDGTDDNRSSNHGVEGDTGDPGLLTVRARQARNLLATMLLSTGTPMLTAGDELWRTQELRQPEYFEGRTTPTGRPDLIWFRPDGAEMTETDWFDEHRRTLGMWIDGSTSRSRNRDGEMISDHTWLLLLHADTKPIDIVLPSAEYGATFEPILDTGTADGAPPVRRVLDAGGSVTLPSRSLLLLRAPR